LHETRNRICLARGDVPCDVLFIGEAPGKSENDFGQCFVGPTGQILDNGDCHPPGIVQRAGMREAGLRLLFSNLIACIPLDESGDKTEEPPDESVRKCASRLVELVEIARPKVLVTVGDEADAWLDPKLLISAPFRGIDRLLPRVTIYHPGRIIRAPWAQRSGMVNHCVMALKRAMREYNLCPS
jgi:DNA polymerase